MSAVFDIGAIEKLVREQNIQTVLVMDSAILLDEPDFKNWRTSLDKPLFVMPCTLDLELQHLKNQPDYMFNACRASDNFVQICSEGEINRGVFREKSGWFISPPSPERKTLESELNKVALLTRSLGKLNTQLILLGREIKQKLPELVVVLVTRDHQVYNTLQLIDIQSHLFSGFPIKIDLKPLRTSAAPDWDQLLQVIQFESEKKSVEVSLTLTRKTTAPVWLVLPHHQTLLLAEGKGFLHTHNDLHFNWTLLFEPWDFPLPESGKPPADANKPLELKSVAEDWLPGKVHLEMDGASNSISPYLSHSIERMILKCSSPMAYIEDLPTVQGPLSVIKQLLIIEYAFEERRLHGDIRSQDFTDMETRLRDPDNLLNWAFFWFHERQSKTEVDVSFSEFLHAIMSCWNLGETHKFILVDQPAEAGRTKEEEER